MRETRQFPIAYDVNKKWGYRVYIKENSEYIPYLVLTDYYGGNSLFGGNVLLLRDYLLDELLAFDRTQSSRMYADCDIDKFLKNEFISRFDDKFRNEILFSTIKITDYPKSHPEGRLTYDTTYISRKILILAYSEVRQKEEYFAKNEGEFLKFFKKIHD